MKFCAVVAIVPDDLEDEAIETARAAGATGVTILAGKGIGGETRKTFFGMTFEGAQTVLLMVVAKQISLPILKQMRGLLVDGSRSRGIAFTLPIEHITGIDMKQVLAFDKYVREEQS
jgi:hypothetical protein